MRPAIHKSGDHQPKWSVVLSDRTLEPARIDLSRISTVFLGRRSQPGLIDVGGESVRAP
jgi:hypothetical protein